MEPELNQRLTVLEQKVDAMFTSVEKLRKYFLWTGVITLILFILPLIGLLFAIPSFLSSYNQIGNIDSLTQ
ncbi:MAG: seg [Parcubacteria group bacterium]|nr:seg [Parcubacteria group bacterium]